MFSFKRDAATAKIRGADLGQVLDIGREGGAPRGDDRIDALAGLFDDGIAGVVDDVGVVALAAGHVVGDFAAIEDVVTGIADQLVVSGIPGYEVIFGSAGENVITRRSDQGIRGSWCRRISGSRCPPCGWCHWRG